MRSEVLDLRQKHQLVRLSYKRSVLYNSDQTQVVVDLRRVVWPRGVRLNKLYRLWTFLYLENSLVLIGLCAPHDVLAHVLDDLHFQLIYWLFGVQICSLQRLCFCRVRLEAHDSIICLVQSTVWADNRILILWSCVVVDDLLPELLWRGPRGRAEPLCLREPFYLLRPVPLLGRDYAIPEVGHLRVVSVLEFRSLFRKHVVVYLLLL